MPSNRQLIGWVAGMLGPLGRGEMLAELAMRSLRPKDRALLLSIGGCPGMERDWWVSGNGR